jgi:polyisoprenoid-binding protein YceI
MNVSKPRWIAAFAALAFVAAAGPVLDALRLKPESRLWFAGTSTVRNWDCKAPNIQAAIDAEAGAPAAVLGGRKAVRTVDLTFPVSAHDCENRTMNNHMRNALNAEQHQSIRFTLTGYTLTKAAATTGTLDGTLMINGQTKPITVPVQFADAAGALRVTGRYPLAMTQWGVQPPRLMMGTMKVGDTITVNFDLLLQP